MTLPKTHIPKRGSYTKRKRRAVQGELRNLMPIAREILHSWFRDKEGTLPYKDIAKRLLSEFDVHVSKTTLSAYYNEKFAEITGTESTPTALDDAATSEAPVIVVRIEIEVPRGFRVDVRAAEGAQS